MNYYVSNLGRLKSKSKTDGSEHILTPTADSKNYLKSSIKLEGGSYGLYVHMAVAKYWSKKPKKKGYNRYIHKDLNRLNNKASNVIWVTDDEWREYVKKRAKKYGYVPHRKGGKPKLKESEVVRIKKHLAAGRMAKSKIAAKFGVSHTQINRIESGENWGGLKIDGTGSKAAKKAPAKKAPAKRKPAAKKTAAKPAARKTATKRKPAAKKPAAKKAPAKKAPAKKAPAKRKPAAKKTAAKPAAKKTAAKRNPAAKKPAAKKAPAKKAPAKKAPAKRKPAAKKTAAKPAAKKTAAKRKPAAKKTAAKKTTTRKSTAKKTTSRSTRKKK